MKTKMNQTRKSQPSETPTPIGQLATVRALIAQNQEENRSERVGMTRSDRARAGDPTKPKKTYRRRRLTLKQRRYVRERLAGKNMYQAAIASGHTVEMARNAGQKIESRLAVRRVLEAALDREGLSDRALGIG